MSRIGIDIPDDFKNELIRRTRNGPNMRAQILIALCRDWGWSEERMPIDGRLKYINGGYAPPIPEVMTGGKTPRNVPIDKDGNLEFPSALPPGFFGAPTFGPSGNASEFADKEARDAFSIYFKQGLRRRGIDTTIVPEVVPVPDHTVDQKDIPALMLEVEARLAAGEIVATLTDAELYVAPAKPKKPRKAAPATVEGPLVDIDPNAFTDEELERMAQGDGEAP